jgi:hypothetical protein
MGYKQYRTVESEKKVSQKIIPQLFFLLPYMTVIVGRGWQILDGEIALPGDCNSFRTRNEGAELPLLRLLIYSAHHHAVESKCAADFNYWKHTRERESCRFFFRLKLRYSERAGNRMRAIAGNGKFPHNFSYSISLKHCCCCCVVLCWPLRPSACVLSTRQSR